MIASQLTRYQLITLQQKNERYVKRYFLMGQVDLE